jgi:hypothetical protein
MKWARVQVPDLENALKVNTAQEVLLGQMAEKRGGNRAGTHIKS